MMKTHWIINHFLCFILKDLHVKSSLIIYNREAFSYELNSVLSWKSCIINHTNSIGLLWSGLIEGPVTPSRPSPSLPEPWRPWFVCPQPTPRLDCPARWRWRTLRLRSRWYNMHTSKRCVTHTLLCPDQRQNLSTVHLANSVWDGTIRMLQKWCISSVLVLWVAFVASWGIVKLLHTLLCPDQLQNLSTVHLSSSVWDGTVCMLQNGVFPLSLCSESLFWRVEEL